MLAVGYGYAKFGVIDKEGNRILTRFVLGVPQCCMVLASVINNDFDLSAGRITVIFLSGFLFYAVLLLLGFLVLRIFHKKDIAGLLSFMTIFGNVGFFGFPVVSSLLGEQALFYAALFLMPFNLLAYSIGPLLITGQLTSGIKPNWKGVFNSVTICSLLSIVLLFIRPTVPLFLEGTIDRFSDLIVPICVVIIGTSLGEIPLKEVFTDWRCYAFALAKLIVTPAVVYCVMRLLLQDTLLLSTMTVLASMPIATIAVMFCIQFGGNTRLASKTVFLSTVLSIVTIPLVCWCLL